MNETSPIHASNAGAMLFANVIKTYAPFLIIPGGFIGNFLSFVVLYKSHHFGQTTSTFYLKTLTITDSLYLLGVPLPRLLLVLGMKPRLQEVGALQVFCRTYIASINLNSNLGRFLWITLSWDRALAFAFPLKSRSFSTIPMARRSVFACACLALLTAMPSIAQPAIYHAQYSHWYCPYLLPHPERQISLIVTIIVTSCTLIIIANTLVSYFLYQSVRERKKLSQDTGDGDFNQMKQVTVMLVAVTTFFLISNIPRMFERLFWPYTSAQIQAQVGWKILSLEMERFLEALNGAINFLLYLIFSSTFRRAAKEIMCSCLSTKSETLNTTSVTALSKE